MMIQAPARDSRPACTRLGQAQTCAAVCIFVASGCAKEYTPTGHICHPIIPELDLPSWFPDADGDGYGDEDAAVHQCDRPAGYLEDGTDCDDADPEIHPGAEELCNGIDDDCTGSAASEVDDDGDGLSECEGDCADHASAAYPGAPEICDGLDDDCDGVLPSEELDLDEDGAIACLDCDDTTLIRAPGNIEVCGDGIDNDCDGAADNDCQECDLVVPFHFATIQEAIDSAGTDEIVCVGQGTWVEQINFNGAEITLLGPYGAEKTILSGASRSGRVVTFDSGEDAMTTMQGFTVRDGNFEGGGIEIRGASPTLVDLIVTDNRATGSGGGIRVTDGSPSMTRLIVSGNDGDEHGGGISLTGSTVSLESVILEDNSAVLGGGLYIDGSDVAIANSRISGNDAGGYNVCAGGGVYAGGASSATLTNVMITDNSATYWSSGGGVYVEDASVSITNALIERNMAWWGGAGVGVDSCLSVGSASTTVWLTNVVVADNATVDPNHYSTYGISGSVACSYSDHYGNDTEYSGGTNNIWVHPGFYDEAGHLKTTSALIDAGDPAIVDPDGSTSDIGLFGGPGAEDLDLDFDGFQSWWLPGAYDPATSPGLDCDDEDASVYPGSGC